MKISFYLTLIYISLIFLSTGCKNKKPAPEKPNLLFVFADQYRKQAVGFMKEDPVITPNLDRMHDPFRLE